MSTSIMPFWFPPLRIVGRALIWTALSSSLCLQAQTTTKSFAADRIVTEKGKTETSRIHATPTALRSEGTQGGKPFIAIDRYDRKVVWSIMPEEKMYVEIRMPAGAEAAGAMNEMAKGLMKDAHVKHESLGSEMVNGFECEKTRTTVSWQGINGSSTEWAAKDLGGFVIKKQDDTLGQVTEYKNIRLGPQDPALFELPAGYKKMSLGGS